MAHVLKAETRLDGWTEVQVATSATRIITLLIRTTEWYQLTADALDAVVVQAVSERRPPVRKR